MVQCTKELHTRKSELEADILCTVQDPVVHDKLSTNPLISDVEVGDAEPSL
jgi:hypothetical protein